MRMLHTIRNCVYVTAVQMLGTLYPQTVLYYRIFVFKILLYDFMYFLIILGKIIVPNHF